MFNERLLVVTGKGGVGKSTFSIALAHYLQDKGKKVQFINFSQGEETQICSELKISFQTLNTKESSKKYIAKKLNSQTIGNWIASTSFFQALFEMVPGLGQLILLGNILYKLEQDKDLTIVLDSPSSGHTISLFESPQNFKNIFGSGLIVEDINKIHKMLESKNLFKCIIMAIPTEMAISESIDLKEALQKYGQYSFKMILNNCLSLNSILINPKIQKDELPKFLQKKIEIEKKLIQASKGSFSYLIPHFSKAQNMKEMAILISKFLRENDEL